MTSPDDPESPADNPAETPTIRRRRFRLALKVTAVSWRDLFQTVGPVVLISTVAVLLALHFVRPAPPSSLTISAGPPGSSFQTAAQQYQKILARNGITLKIVTSEGSLDNLNRLTDASSGVDVAFVQSGITGEGDASDLVSLGSMFYQPVIIFYRSRDPMERLSELRGRRIAIGAKGSGTRVLSLALLKDNEIAPDGTTKLLDLEGEAARSALLNGELDAIMMSGDSASPSTIREMLHARGIRLYDFPQADAYIRRFPYLSKLTIPAGAFDLGENLPPKPINMVAPTVELLSHTDLHPALSDLLIEAALEVHSRATLLQNAGQFPTPQIHSFPISTEAARYYKSGRSFAYRYLPFWLASLFTRAAVILVPLFVVVIPGLRYLPQLYNWRIRRRIHRRYGELMALEREALAGNMSEEWRAVLLERVDEIERATIKVKMPGSHAEALYALRQHLRFVRERLTHAPVAGSDTPPPPSAEESSEE
jgi:TRAP transporter TAXI family solute receptor